MKMEMIPTNKLKPDPNQPRQQIDNEAVERLAATYEREGIISPIEITPDFKILVGELRWRAAKKAGLKEVPVIINDKEDYKKADRRLERQLIENETRKDLNIIDRAKAYKKYVDSGHSERELAKLLGYKSHAIVREIINLLDTAVSTIKHLQKDSTNWTLHRDLETESNLSREQKDKFHEKIIAKEFKTQDELAEILEFMRHNPESKKDMLEAKDELDRNLAKLRTEKPEYKEYKPRVESKLDPDKKLLNDLINSLNIINQSRIIWLKSDVIKVIKNAPQKTQDDILKSIKTIIKVWDKTLGELD